MNSKTMNEVGGSRLVVSWLRTRAEACLLTALECDERADTFWAWFTGQRSWFRKEAAWWRVEQNDWNDLADELEEQLCPWIERRVRRRDE